MKIATYINENGNVVSFREKGSVCLYENMSGLWIKKKKCFFTMNDITSLAEARFKFINIVSQLEDCKIFLLGELRGLQHALLEEMGFHTWKSDGELFEQLNFVARKENEIIINEKSSSKDAKSQDSCRCRTDCSTSAKELCGTEPLDINRPIPVPLPVGNNSDGYYKINLAEVLRNDLGLNSRQVLIPFMETTAFKKLEIFCDHLPRWFLWEIEHLNLRKESETLDASGYGIKIIVIPNN